MLCDFNFQRRAMKLNRIVSTLAMAGALLGFAQTAAAGLVVQVSSGGAFVTVYDNLAGDDDSLLGGIDFSGAVGAWEVAMAVGESSLDPFSLHLTSMVKGTAGDGPITLKITQTGLLATGPTPQFFADGGGSGAYGSAASWSAWVDDANTEFGQGVQIANSIGYGTVGDSVYAALSGTYSATIITTFDYSLMGLSNRRQSSLDVSMGVPEPTSLALVGLGLVGAGFARRRKAQA